MEVKKIMTKNPACCTSDSTLQEVAHMMEMYDCGCIPVVDSHQTMRPVGTITDRDITIRTFSAGKNPLEMTASDIMTTDIETIMPNSSVKDCMDVMEDKQIRRILVVDKNGKCTGIVAQADLAEHVTQYGETADFIREVSESEKSRGRENDSYRSFGGRDDSFERENYSYAQNRQSEKRFETHERPRAKKQSFFSGKMLLTLLGSVGLGAGLKYYVGLDDNDKKRLNPNRKIKTNHISQKPTSVNSMDSSLSSTTLTGVPSSTIESREIITGSVDSFNTINDRDLKPITEVGKTASNG